MTLNEHVNYEVRYVLIGVFTPDEGYALWDDTQEGNLDENGEPIHYYLSMQCGTSRAEERAPHIHARLIEEGMHVYGVTKPKESV